MVFRKCYSAPTSAMEETGRPLEKGRLNANVYRAVNNAVRRGLRRIPRFHRLACTL